MHASDGLRGPALGGADEGGRGGRFCFERARFESVLAPSAVSFLVPVQVLKRRICVSWNESRLSCDDSSRDMRSQWILDYRFFRKIGHSGQERVDNRHSISSNQIHEKLCIAAILFFYLELF
jgi:hypothetical protein